MSETSPRLGSRRMPARQLLAAVSKAPRKVRIAGLAALAGAAAVVALPAAANASTVNPTCTVPAGVSYQLVERITVINPEHQGGLPPRYTFSGWEAFSNGVYYNGAVEGVGAGIADNPVQALAARVNNRLLGVVCTTSSSPAY
jgi:hypothetical protein